MRNTRLTCCAAVLTLLACPARAQSAADPVVNLAPVVVGEHLLTESPATVTTVPLDPEPRVTATPAAVAARTANFFVAANGARSFTDVYALRGLTNTPLFGDPAVAVYLDDLPLGSAFTFPSDLAGFDRAELHRGPTQNTVFGRAGSAGVLVLATPEPGPVARGSLVASAGSAAARAFSVSASTAAGGPVDAYVSAGSARRDGFITNTYLHRQVDGQSSSSGLVRLRWRTAGAGEWTLLANGLRARDGVQPLVPLGGPRFLVNRHHEGESDLDTWNAALSGAFATPAGRLTVTTSVNDWRLGPYDNALQFGPAELLSQVALRQHTWNEEVKLAGDPRAAVRWQAGAFWSDGRTDGAFNRSFGPFPYERSAYRIDARTLAGFAEASWRIAPALTLTAGLRGEDARKTMHRSETVPKVQVFDGARDAAAVLPKLGLAFAADCDTTWFATAGAGFKPGGFSAFTGVAALAAFGPERTRTLEAGVTRAWPASRASVTARTFFYDIDGYQIERSFATGGPGNEYLVVNAPRARSLGAELEAAWRPVPAVELAASGGWTDVTLRTFTDPFTHVSYAGRRAPAVPVLDAHLRARYTDPTGFFAGAEWSATGRTYYTEGEDLALGQRAYAVVGAQAGYATGRWRVTLFGENLANAEYFSAITPGTGHGTPGAPRTWGAELGVRW